MEVIKSVFTNTVEPLEMDEIGKDFLSNQPDLILNLICEFLPHCVDIINLSLTCQRLHQIVLSVEAWIPIFNKYQAMMWSNRTNGTIKERFKDFRFGANVTRITARSFAHNVRSPAELLLPQSTDWCRCTIIGVTNRDEIVGCVAGALQQSSQNNNASTSSTISNSDSKLRVFIIRGAFSADQGELIYNAFVNRIMDAVERGGHEIMGVYVDVLPPQSMVDEQTIIVILPECIHLAKRSAVMRMIVFYMHGGPKPVVSQLPFLQQVSATQSFTELPAFSYPFGSSKDRRDSHRESVMGRMIFWYRELNGTGRALKPNETCVVSVYLGGTMGTQLCVIKL